MKSEENIYKSCFVQKISGSEIQVKINAKEVKKSEINKQQIKLAMKKVKVCFLKSKDI